MSHFFFWIQASAVPFHKTVVFVSRSNLPLETLQKKLRQFDINGTLGGLHLTDICKELQFLRTYIQELREREAHLTGIYTRFFELLDV
ncbi:unnamed protein product [Ixodes persulcatus]